jgi:hypothetical protein
MKKIFLTLMILLAISACGGKVNTAVPISAEPVTESTLDVVEIEPKATPVCIDPEPTQADVDRALAYPGDVVSGADWERTYTVGNGRVSVTWFNNSLASIIYLEALIFPCMYEELDLDNFFNDENWQVIFGNYESYEPVAACKTNDGLRLYEFKAIADGFEYDIKYWAENDTDTRVIGAMLVLPIESVDLMNEYSNTLFPTLADCP